MYIYILKAELFIDGIVRMIFFRQVEGRKKDSTSIWVNDILSDVND